MTPAQIHNRNAAAIVQQIIKPTLDAGGEMTDVLVLLESVILGVMFVSVKLGGDEIVLDQVVAGVNAWRSSAWATSRPRGVRDQLLSTARLRSWMSSSFVVVFFIV